MNILNNPITQYEIKKSPYILCQDLYEIELFKKISNIVICYEYTYFTSIRIQSLLPQNWSGLRFFKKNKNLHIFNISFNKELPIKNYNILQKLTNNQLEKIYKAMQSDSGFFLTDFENIDNTESIIFIKEQQIPDFNQILGHELIHYFQWNTGKSIYNIKSIIENDNNNINMINKLFNCSLTIDDLNKIINKKELVTYAFQIFNTIKKLGEQNRKFIINTFNLLFLVFKPNIDDLPFESFWINSLKKSKDLFEIYNEYNDIILNKNHLIIPILLSAFYNIGYYTLKNHIYGYIDKELKK